LLKVCKGGVQSSCARAGGARGGEASAAAHTLTPAPAPIPAPGRPARARDNPGSMRSDCLGRRRAGEGGRRR